MAYGNDNLPGGHSANHSPTSPFPILAATTTGKEKNVIRQDLLSVACWRLNDVRFDFGSSFVVPEAKEEFEALALVCQAHAGAPLSIFGHADPVGNDDFNKVLSGRRAEAVYAVVTHDVARWEKLYGAEWGDPQIQSILKALQAPSVLAFQQANQLAADGVAGPQTREKLFAKYFQFLFPEPLPKNRFLGQGADADGKADFQGCSEFNPAMVFSKAENDAFAKSGSSAARNAENAVNRRVLVLFFRPGTIMPPSKWPCPRANEGSSGCKKRFWSDGPERRSYQSKRREFAETSNTFACRFYHRLVQASPCESSAADLLFVEIFIDVPKDADDFEDQFQLVSSNGQYDVTIPRSAAIERPPNQVVLIFTNVISGLPYSLRHFPNAEVRFDVFENVPFQKLDNAGGGAARLKVLETSAKDREPKPRLATRDPLIHDDPADFYNDESWYADPHESGAAYL
ncbi:MAG TPA: OmpA family protein [Bryobacteraceae bacterium]|nr:OmpA family protein [Bryobacteraceae bacterium]